MIVQSSAIQMSVEHEKHEVITRSQSMSSEGLSNFNEMFQQARSSAFLSQLFFGPPESTDVDNDGGTSSVLVMTDEGFKFRTDEDKQITLMEQQSLTRAKLLESLLKAINPDNNYAINSPKIDLPDQGVEHPHSPAQPIQLQPITLQMNFKVTESIEEYECTNFHSCGVVQTADGQEIEFNLGLSMERSYSARREFEMSQEVTFKDPLIVNFAGNAADLSDDKYEFDIDADGQNDLISYLLGDSGMLALDKNNDGVINDGSELFGGLTGNGFAELAEYDEDGNQFIDEADSVFADLSIWRKKQDSETLQSLSDAGIGAIYLGSSDSPFDIKGEDNQINGRVISSGVYLTDSGQAGTVQQIDMVV